MIRCPSCKMLNRLGSIHCGFCGHLLTDKEGGAAVEPGFKAPKLRPSDSGEEELPLAAPKPAPSRQTIFGMKAEEILEAGPVASRTVVGMPAVQVEHGGPLPPGVAEARAAAVRLSRRTGAEPAGPGIEELDGPGRAQVVLSGEAADALADTPPPRPEARPPRRSRPPSKTLFGMRAAELHLGLADAEASEPPPSGPSLKEAFPSLSDTAEHRAVPDFDEPDPGEDETAPAAAFARRPSGARIEAVATLRPEGAAFADTAVIQAVDPDSPEMKEAIARAQAEAEARGIIPAGGLPEGADGAVAPLMAPPESALAAPSPDLGPPASAVAPPVQAGAVTRDQAPTAPVAVAAAGPVAPGRLRGLGLLGGAALLAATLFPLSASTWARVDFWADLGPLVLAAIGLTLAVTRGAPRALLAALGVLALAVGVGQFVAVGLPGEGAGAGAAVRFLLVVAGAALLGVASLAAVSRGPRRPDQPPPRSSG